MHRLQTVLRIALAAALLAASPAGAAPPQVMTYSGYLKTSSGTAVTSPTNIAFRLYTTPGGGTPVWTETVSVTPSSDGWFSAVIGTVTSLPFSILNQDLYLSLQVGADAEFPQRARVTPSSSALTVDWGGVQGKPTCGAGQYLTLDGTGALACSIPAGGGTGGIASVSGSSPINASTAGSAVTVGLAGCASANQILQWSGTAWGCIATPSGGGFTPPLCGSAGQVMQWNGSAWQCATDATGLTSVAVTSPLTGNGTSGQPLGLAGCASANQILQWNGASWSCIATPSGGGGGVASVNPNLGSGLEISPTTGAVVASMRRDCTDNQVLKWTAAGGWACAADANSGGTLTNVTVSGGALSATGTTVRDIALGAASNVASGYVTAADYVAFSGKAPAPAAACLPGEALSWTGTGFTCLTVVTSVTGVGPITSTTGSSPVVRIAGCANGEILKYSTVSGSWICNADLNSGGTVTSVAAGTGLVSSSGFPITANGALAIDTAVVPQLGVASNAFAGGVSAASFSGNGSGLTSLNAGNLASGTVPSARVAGAYGGITGVGTLTGLTLSGDVNVGNNVVRNMVPAIAQQNVGFSVNAADTFTGSPSVTRGDGVVTITTSAATAQVADLRPNNSFALMGAPTTGSYLTFRGNILISETSQTVYVMHGAPTGIGSQTGGYGFRFLGNGAGSRTVSGLVMGSGSTIASQTAGATLSSGMHSFLAINRGASVEFFVDGTSLGTASTATMNTGVFTTYCVRVDQGATAAAGGNIILAYMTLGVPVP